MDIEKLNNRELIEFLFKFEGFSNPDDYKRQFDIMLWNANNIPQYKLSLMQLAQFQTEINPETKQPYLRHKLTIVNSEKDSFSLNNNLIPFLNTTNYEQQELNFFVDSQNNAQPFNLNENNAHELSHAIDLFTKLIYEGEEVIVNGETYNTKKVYNEFHDFRAEFVKQYNLNDNITPIEIISNESLKIPNDKKIEYFVKATFASDVIGLFIVRDYGKADFENMAMQTGNKPFSATIGEIGYLSHYGSFIAEKQKDYKNMIASIVNQNPTDLKPPYFTGSMNLKDARNLIKTYSLPLSDLYTEGDPLEALCFRNFIKEGPEKNCHGFDKHLPEKIRKDWERQVTKEDYTNVNAEEEAIVQSAIKSILTSKQSDKKIIETALEVSQGLRDVFNATPDNDFKDLLISKYLKYTLLAQNKNQKELDKKTDRQQTFYLE